MAAQQSELPCVTSDVRCPLSYPIAWNSGVATLQDRIGSIDCHLSHGVAIPRIAAVCHGPAYRGSQTLARRLARATASFSIWRRARRLAQLNGPLTRAGWSRLPCVFETDSPGTSNGGKSRPGVLRPRALDRHTADRQSSLTPKIPIQNDYGPLRARKLRDTPRAVPRWRASWASRGPESPSCWT